MLPDEALRWLRGCLSGVNECGCMPSSRMLSAEGRDIRLEGLLLGANDGGAVSETAGCPLLSALSAEPPAERPLSACAGRPSLIFRGEGWKLGGSTVLRSSESVIAGPP